METWPENCRVLPDSLKNTLFREQGAGKAAYALSNSCDLRCRVILEQIKDYNQFLRTRPGFWAWPW